MPVKLNSKLPTESAEARIEIIPLIDIMFFLLASFMLVSISMVNMKSVKVNLPTAVSASPESHRDFVDISVDDTGSVYLDKKPIGAHELTAALAPLEKANPNLRVFISGDKDARHGRMIEVLDAVRTAGIDKVAFEITTPTAGGSCHPMKPLAILNFLGVLVLAAVCLLQWQYDHHLNARIQSLETAHALDTSRLADRDKTIQGQTADLDDFRARLTRAGDASAQLQSKLKSAATQTAQLAAERDDYKSQSAALKESLEKWTAAVAARDQALKQADAQLQKLAADRNDAVQKFNDLAAKYNAAAADLKRAADDIARLTADRNDAVQKFNDLAGKYNALAATQPTTNR